MEGACDALVCEASRRWKKAAVVPEDEVVDDITVVLSFLSIPGSVNTCCPP